MSDDKRCEIDEMSNNNEEAPTVERRDALDFSEDLILSKNRMFGIGALLLQVLVIFLFAFLLRIPTKPLSDALAHSQEITPIVLAFSIYLFVLIGFGLFFSYTKGLALSGIGFTLLLTCLSVEMYFLMNAFWTAVDIGGNGEVWVGQSKIYLSDTKNSIFEGQEVRFRSSLVEAVKCALSNCIAFSAVLGRVGPFEILLISIIGTVGYTLNRYVIEMLGLDYGFSYRLFAFAGFMGLMMGLLLRTKQNSLASTGKNKRYSGNKYSIALSFLGSLFIFALFPIFILDQPQETSKMATAPIYFASLNIFYSVSSSLIIVLALSCLTGIFVPKVFITAILAGGIAVSSASFYITNPFFAMIVGSLAAIMQFFICKFEQKLIKSTSIIATVSLLMFCVHGLFGSVWSCIFRASIVTMSDGFTFNYDEMSEAIFEFVACLISIGMGCVFGVVLGGILKGGGAHGRVKHHFNDLTYWHSYDGMGQPEKTKMVKVIQKSQIKQRYAYI